MKKNMEDFLIYLKRQKNYSNYTILNYEIDINKYQNFLNQEKLNYKFINYKSITEYLVYLNKLNLKPSSISRNLSSLRSFYNYLLKEQIIKNNVFNLVNGMKKEKKLPNTIDIIEFEEILDSIKNDSLGKRNRCILEVMLGTGVRVGELTNIKLEDINYEEKKITITGKGNKQRIVYFGDYALNSIKDYLEYSRKNLTADENNTYLFLNNKGHPITQRGISDILERILKKISIGKKISPHTMRHSFATLMMNEGCDLKTVQELLGHASLNTTSIYTHVSSERLKNEYLKAHPRARGE